MSTRLTDPAAVAAASEAVASLQPHADADPAFADALGALRAIAGESEDDAALEKSMTRIANARDSLAKAEGVSAAQAVEVEQRLANAERALGTEYMRSHSAGFAKAEANKAEAERLRGRNFGRAA
jgi:hypothetical protein